MVARQKSKVLPELDRWYRTELPDDIARREPPHVTVDELARLTEWKMARGVWRARNLALVRGNPAALVQSVSAQALATMPDARDPIAILTKLEGVGPATASAVAAAAAPDQYPFFDDLVARQITDLGPVDFTLPYYVRYAQAIRERASGLGSEWIPAMVERALWAHSGGKVALK